MPWFDRTAVLKLSAFAIRKSIQDGFYSKPGELASSPADNKGFDQNEPFAIYFMLWGYAFETLLKGGYIRIKGTLEKEATDKGHDLIGLAKLLELEVRPGDVKILELLTKYIVWAGRYPIPLDHTNYSEEGLPIHNYTEWQQGGDRAFERSIRMLYGRFQKAILNRQDWLDIKLGVNRPPVV